MFMKAQTASAPKRNKLRGVAVVISAILIILIYFAIPPKCAMLPLVENAHVTRDWEVCKDATFAVDDVARSEDIIKDRLQWGEKPFSWSNCPDCSRADFSVDPKVVRLPPVSKTSLTRLAYSGYIGPIQSDMTKGLGPVYTTCNHMERLGNPGEDEERLVCAKKKASTKEDASCVIFSIGSNNQFSFEEEVVHRLKSPCVIHTFDCTVAEPKVPVGLPLVYHKLCLGSKKEKINGLDFASIKDFVELTGGRQPELLKIDIEGWEWIALVNLMETAAQVRRETGKNIYPDQIALEIHFHDIPWSWGYFWDQETMAYFNFFFYDHGYVVAYNRPNPWCRACFEILLVRLKCNL